MRRTSPRIRPTTVVLLVAAALTGCRTVAADHMAARGAPGIRGTFALAHIDGHPLPYAPRHPDGPAAPEIFAGALRVSPDRTFRLTLGIRLDVDGVAQLRAGQSEGTYARFRTGYTFTWAHGGAKAVTLRGDTLIVNNEGLLFFYVRRREG